MLNDLKISKSGQGRQPAPPAHHLSCDPLYFTAVVRRMVNVVIAVGR
jgi:hypothetical protein